MGAFTVIKIFDLEPRERGRCDGCDRRRLRTRLRIKTYAGKIADRWWCNECLTTRVHL